MNIFGLFMPSNAARVRNIEQNVDLHMVDEIALQGNWRIFCRNKNCKDRMTLLSHCDKDFAKKDKKPVLIHGFAFCEDCAKIIQTGEGRYIDLDKSNMGLYQHQQVKDLYSVLYGEVK